MNTFHEEAGKNAGICRIENGNIYLNNGSNIIIRFPALLLCEDEKAGTCTVIRYGEAETLRREMNEKSAVYAKSGLGCLTLIELDTERLTLQEQCYILRRSVEYSASPFPAELSRRINSQDGDALRWLCDEMKRVPIEVI